MKKTVSKIAIAAIAAAMTFTSMINISASANDGMTKEESDAAAAAANAAAAAAEAEAAEGYVTDYEYTTPSQPNILTSGTWYSMTPAGPRTYVFEYNAPSAEYRDEYSGVTNYFTYDLNGSYLTAYNNRMGTTLYATVSYVDSETITISWNEFTETLKTTKEAARKAAGVSNIFAQGNWYSRDMSGIIDYWFNPDSATGVRTCEGTGKTENFSYEFEGNRIIFTYSNTSSAGTVSYSGYDMIISWDNGFVETLSTTYPTIETQPAVTTVTTTDNSRYNQPMLARGTWYASSYTGTRTYCFDLIEPVGCLIDFGGIEKTFDYTLDGNDLWLHFTNAAKGEHATVTYNADGSFTLSWASGLVETFTKNIPTPVTTPVVTSTVAPVQATTTTAIQTTTTAASTKAQQSSSASTTTAAAQSAKKAPASTDSPKTGDTFPIAALAIAALAAGTAGIVSSKKFSNK